MLNPDNLLSGFFCYIYPVNIGLYDWLTIAAHFEFEQQEQGLNQEPAIFNPLDLYPFTQTKAVSALRVGISTMLQKWEFAWQQEIACFSSFEMQHTQLITLAISAHIIPNPSLLMQLKALAPGQALLAGRDLIAIYFPEDDTVNTITCMPYTGELERLKHIEDIFMINAEELKRDYLRLTSGRRSASLPAGNTALGDDYFIAGDVQIDCTVLNTRNGPIYIDEGAQIMEGSLLRGPLYIGKNAVVKMGTQVYGNVSIGEGAVIGGELGQVVLGDYAAKGHYGYLGCSVIGDFCNLGAGTSNSNLKNNLTTVSLFDYTTNAYRDTGLLKCGLFMGDYSRTGINSAFNTGTVVGVGCMLADVIYYPKYLPNMTWLYNGKQENYQIDKFVSNLEVVFLTKNKSLSEKTKELLKSLKK